ncbi:hypothetical protein T11_6096 [Trichinella zimbabwensis]|uniref:Uncharacterized protein n=1 Tax=Trichinella zimbabwensis TaxID=268475 RepID=A0A0V1GY74_9BILA|nr:hypothetical protein T11_12429 [Trichinella zimbabwensis]KRZ03271.1 hypothetical protein T11_6096 [Trichinella zimbabwensis]
MGPCEPEDFCHVLPDEGDFGPCVEEAVHHHVVSVRPVGASTGGLEAPTWSAPSGQEAVVGSVGPR